jgi:hypothetical protein
MARLKVRLDRIRVVSWAAPGRKPPDIPGFVVTSDFRLNRRADGTPPAYARVKKFKSTTSDAKADWEYQRNRGWLKHWRITLIADDQAGLTPEEVEKFLKHCQFYRLTLVELAMDFGPGSGVDRDFVRRHGLFGKSRRVLKNVKAGELRYGSRKSGKFVRGYWKAEIDAFRVELEMHSALLRKHRIDEKTDISDVAFVIQPKHLLFGRFRWNALSHYVRRRFGMEGEAILEITRQKANISIHSTMKYLRRMGVNNPHRFVVPMKINDRIKSELTKWALNFTEGMNDAEN